MTTEAEGVPRPSRYFLALLPDDSARERLAALCQPGDGRCVPAPDLHLTLAFLGELRVGSPAALLDKVAGAVVRGPVEVALDRIEAWRGPRALCAVGEMPAVTVLADALWADLVDLGYHRDTRPFRGHVTLARNLPAAVCRQAARPLMPPVRWTSRELWLMASRPGRMSPGEPRYVRQAVLHFTP